MNFTSNSLDDELFISDFDREETPKMILYAFLAIGYVANGRSCCCGVAVQCTRNSKTLTAFTPQRPLPSLAEGCMV